MSVPALAIPGQVARRRTDDGWPAADALLVSVTLGLALIGSLMITSATYKFLQASGKDPLFYLKRHLLFMVLGVPLFVLVASIDYRVWADRIAFFYVLAVLALLAVLVPQIGTYNNGARAWFSVGQFQLQPSEFAKLVMIIALATYGEAQRGMLNLRRLLVVLSIAGLPILLILREPDLGTSLVFIAIVAAMMWGAGARARHLLVLAVAAVGVAVVAVKVGAIRPYQIERIQAFLDPSSSAGYQVRQSKIAIGAGGLWGAGLFSGTQTESGFVPFRHTDFIFSAVGEQLGFVGAGLVLGLFVILAWRILRTAHLARDAAGSLICVGVLAMFLFQIFENVGMAMGMMPVTGIPLPFLSYGGTSTLVSFAAMGLVASVGMHRFR